MCAKHRRIPIQSARKQLKERRTSSRCASVQNLSMDFGVVKALIKATLCHDIIYSELNRLYVVDLYLAYI